MFVLGYSISFFLEYALLVLKSLKGDLEAMSLLSEFNYSNDTIEEGINIHTIAQTMESAQIRYHAEMSNFGAQFDDLYKKAHSQFIDYSGIILLEFKNDMDIKLKTLASQTTGERNPIRWMKKAKEFYNYVMKTPKIMERIDQYNITTEKMTGLLNNVIAAEDAKAKFLNAKGNAQDAITKRDAALMSLAIWVKKLLKVSTVAFKSRPQFMEKCGIVVLSEGYKRARAVQEGTGTNDATKIIMPPDME